MVREIITIDEEKCNGCGNCVPGCPEGALQIIDGKARLVSDLHCDGLGACIGECPTGALEIERREAEPYDEKKTMQNIMRAGDNTIRAHLKHLLQHGENTLYQEACEALREAGLNPDEYGPASTTAGEAASAGQEAAAAVQGSAAPAGGPVVHHHASGGGCPGSRMIDMRRNTAGPAAAPTPTGPHHTAPHNAPVSGGPGDTPQASQLQQWPVQMHLISPRAPYFQKADLLLAADCVAYAVGDFHSRYLAGKRLAVACPKLDSNQDVYVQKLIALIDEAEINTITVVLMEVPCCGGLLRLARAAAEQASRKIPIKAVVVNLQGEELQSEWVWSGSKIR